MTNEDYIASVGLTAGTYAPMGAALCLGQTMSINQNSALYYLVKTLYGGNGVATFNLPNLAGSTVIGAGQQAVTGAVWQQGQTAEPLTELAWPDGHPAVLPAGGTPTIPTVSGPTGLALNWAIALVGIFPPQASLP